MESTTLYVGIEETISAIKAADVSVNNSLSGCFDEQSEISEDKWKQMHQDTWARADACGYDVSWIYKYHNRCVCGQGRKRLGMVSSAIVLVIVMVRGGAGVARGKTPALDGFGYVDPEEIQKWLEEFNDSGCGAR